MRGINSPFRRQLTGALIGLLLGTILVFFIAMTLRVWQLAEDQQETLDLIRSCTSPQGECYKRGQENTGGAINTINQVTIYATACADDPENQSAREVRNCVYKKLERAERKAE